MAVYKTRRDKGLVLFVDKKEPEPGDRILWFWFLPVHKSNAAKVGALFLGMAGGTRKSSGCREQRNTSPIDVPQTEGCAVGTSICIFTL